LPSEAEQYARESSEVAGHICRSFTVGELAAALRTEADRESVVEGVAERASIAALPESPDSQPSDSEFAEMRQRAEDGCKFGIYELRQQLRD